MKIKTPISKFLRVNRGTAQREIYSFKPLFKKKLSEINYLNFYLKKLEGLIKHKIGRKEIQ